MSNMVQKHRFTPYAHGSLRVLQASGRCLQWLLRLLYRGRLKQAQKALRAMQKHLATTRRPRLRATQARRLAQCLNMPVDFLLVEPIEVVRMRVAEALTRVEAELTRVTSSS